MLLHQFLLLRLLMLYWQLLRRDEKFQHLLLLEMLQRLVAKSYLVQMT
jgi:hypothetical protein